MSSAAWLVVLPSTGAAAGPVSFEVDTTTDATDEDLGDGACATAAGRCSLRAAVQEGNLNDGDVHIEVPAGTYTLGLGEIGDDSGGSLDITGREIEIAGAGEDATVIDVDPAVVGRIFQIELGATLFTKDLAIAGATNSALFVSGRYVAVRTTIRDNEHVGPPGGSPSGAAIFVDGGSVDLTETTVRDNVTALGDGAITNIDGELEVEDSLFTRNIGLECCGGAIYNRSVGGTATAFIDNTAFIANSVQTFGGGAVYNGGEMSIQRSVFSANSVGLCCGGAIFNRNGLEMVDTVIDGNRAADRGGGGGVYASSGTVQILRSTISNNLSDGTDELGGGGGLLVDGADVLLVNVTISGNRAPAGFGGGVSVVAGSLASGHLTIAANTATSGGGLSIEESDAASTVNTLFGDNAPTACSGETLVSQGHNLADDASCDLSGTGDVEGVDPQLDALADNGGFTPTHALGPTSPARDAGDPSVCNGLFVDGVDQRGVTREAPCDIGAFDGSVTRLVGGEATDADEDGVLSAGDEVDLAFDGDVATRAPELVVPEVSVTFTDDDGDAASFSNDPRVPDGTTPAELTTSPDGRTVTVSVDGAPVVTGDGDGALDGTVSVTACQGIVYDLDGDGVADIDDPREPRVACDPGVEIEIPAAPPPPPPREVCAGVPEDGFVDVPPENVHESAVDCVAASGVVRGGPQGRPGNEFGPELNTLRGQLASMVVRSMAAAGVDLPPDPPDAYDDDDGSVHELAIDQLAALGVAPGAEGRRFFPDVPVARDVMAAFVNAAHEAITGERLASAEDFFGDDEASPYEADINGLAAAGIVRGRSPGVFEPGSPIRRDQLASFFARHFQVLSDAGFPVAVD